MVTQEAALSDQSPGEPISKRAKPTRVTETSTTVQSTMACASQEHKIIESPEVEVNEQDPEVIEALVKKAQDPVEDCSNCTVLENTVRKLKNRIVSLEDKVKKLKLSNRRSNYRIEGEYSVCYFMMYQLICLNNVMCDKLTPSPLFKIKY